MVVQRQRTNLVNLFLAEWQDAGLRVSE